MKQEFHERVCVWCVCNGYKFASHMRVQEMLDFIFLNEIICSSILLTRGMTVSVFSASGPCRSLECLSVQRI